MPALILLGLVLVVFQPRISAWVGAPPRRRRRAARDGAWWVWPAVLLAGVYGGYFGAAQGVLLMAILGIGVDESLQRLNAVKNVLAAVVNGVAGLLFIVVATSTGASSALIGGRLGGRRPARRHRRPPAARRPCCACVIVVVGVVALGSFLLG